MGKGPVDDRALQRFAEANGLDWQWGGGRKGDCIHVWIRVTGTGAPIWMSSNSADVSAQDLFIQVLGWVRQHWQEQDRARRHRVEALRSEAPYRPRR